MLPETDRQIASKRLTEAIGLVRLHSPRACRNLASLVDGIVVFGAAGPLASWFDDVGLLILSEQYVLAPDTVSGELATTIVHELTHAWLDRLGIPYNSGNRARVERTCARAERDFAVRLLEPGRAVARAEAQLAAPDISFSDDAYTQRKVRYLQELGVPRWLIRLRHPGRV